MTALCAAASAQRKLWTWAAIAIAPAILALFYFSQAYAQKIVMRDPTPAWQFFVTWLIGCYIFALLIFGVLWLGRRFRITRQNWLGRLSLHVLFSLCFAAMDLGLAAAIYPRVGVIPSVFKDFSSAFGFLLVTDFHGSVIAYWIVLGAQAGFRYYRRYQQRERDALRLELQASELKTQLARAQLRALKTQLQPHFLFNTLNAITVLVRQRRTDLAEDMLGGLSDLLRCVLEDVDAQEVPLSRELEYLRIYLAIQQVRFQDRLKTVIAADPDTLDAAVPQMALQPIVENAILHGIGARSSAGKLSITASRHHENLVIRVQDDGPGFPAATTDADGIGLANTRARLRQLYRNAAELITANAEKGGAVVTLVLPYHLMQHLPATEIMEVHGLQNANR